MVVFVVMKQLMYIVTTSREKQEKLAVRERLLVKIENKKNVFAHLEKKTSL